MADPVDNVSNAHFSRSFAREESLSTPVGRSFDSYMGKGEGGTRAMERPSMQSPFDLANNGSSLNKNFSFDSLVGQASSAQMVLGGINAQLNTPNLKLKKSDKYLLRSKLTSANEVVNAVSKKLQEKFPGVSYTHSDKNQEEIPDSGVMGKFLSFISQGEKNLRSVQDFLVQIKNSGMEFKPGDYLQVQIKLAHAQQLIEFSSIVLSKAVDSMKTIFNIQI